MHEGAIDHSEGIIHDVSEGHEQVDVAHCKITAMSMSQERAKD